MSNPTYRHAAINRILAPPARDPIQPLRAAPTFSVVIPAYQAAATIGGAVASVLAQTVTPCEIIVSDDGSTDQLEDALEPFASRIRLIRNPHGGVSAARNAGLEAASADFVLFLDADDILLSRKLEALGQLGQARPDLDLLCTDVWFEVGGRRSGRFNEANPFAVTHQRAAILERCFVGWPAVRRSRVLDAGGFDTSLSIAHDWDCWIRLMLDGSVAGLHDEPLSVYRIRAGSLTDSRPSALQDRVLVMRKARTHPGLRPEERPILERSLAIQHAKAVLAEAQAAVADRHPDARRCCLELARTPGIPIQTRLRALAASVSPVGIQPRLLQVGAADSVRSRAPEEGPTDTAG